MAYVYNSERTFKDEMIDGLVAAYGRYQRRVPGTAGVVSVSAPTPGRVSTIVGGGSGHYPSFAGLVGPGFADAAVCGDIFTSPSAAQVLRTIRAVDAGAGVLMMFGNYAGDVMHFGLAADQARSQQGIDARIVLVTDDIASAPPDRAADRRGIAGDFFVFRAAASAAHRGDKLDEVERVAIKANTATFTIGVAFDGVTVPGRDEPLFTVDPGTMVLGLGIHGEPGIQSMPLADARGLADLLVERLLAERPPGADRARILVNGLGRVKYEEMFILYLSAAAHLEDAGVRLTEPEIGEFVTSLDMGGCSITLVWTDDELEELLSTPAATPGYTRPGPVPGLDGTVRPFGPATADVTAAPPLIDAADLTASGAAARRALAAVAARMHDLEGHLGDLDAVAADGDHGTTMTRGMDAALDAARRAGPDASAVLLAAGMAFADAAGGAAGALWGSGLTTIGAVLGTAGTDRPGAPFLAGVWEQARDAVVRLGGSVPGDKTVVDALDGFVRDFRSAADQGHGITTSWAFGAAAAERAAEATAAMRARRGRAARLADRSVGTPDPGAVSLAAALTAAGAVLTIDDPGGTP
jgi:dihydroxyacetone kinase